MEEPSPNEASQASSGVITTVNISQNGETIPLFTVGHGLAGRVQPEIARRAIAANLIAAAPAQPIIMVDQVIRVAEPELAGAAGGHGGLMPPAAGPARRIRRRNVREQELALWKSAGNGLKKQHLTMCYVIF